MNEKFFNEGNLIHNVISSSGSGISYGSGSGSEFLTSYGSGSTSQKVTVLTVPVPVPQHWPSQGSIPWVFKNLNLLRKNKNSVLDATLSDVFTSIYVLSVPGSGRNRIFLLLT